MLILIATGNVNKKFLQKRRERISLAQLELRAGGSPLVVNIMREFIRAN